VTDFLLHLCIKNDHSILTGDWSFWSILNGHFYCINVTKSQSPVNIEWSFLLHKCNKNFSHLLILSGHFYQFNINRWLTFLLHLCSPCSKKNQLNINRWLTFLLHFYSKKGQFNINRWLILNWSFLLHKLHKCKKKVSHLLILNWPFLL
jgi:hypothetical protein